VFHLAGDHIKPPSPVASAALLKRLKAVKKLLLKDQEQIRDTVSLNKADKKQKGKSKKRISASPKSGAGSAQGTVVGREQKQAENPRLSNASTESGNPQVDDSSIQFEDAQQGWLLSSDSHVPGDEPASNRISSSLLVEQIQEESTRQRKENLQRMQSQQFGASQGVPSQTTLSSQVEPTVMASSYAESETFQPDSTSEFEVTATEVEAKATEAVQETLGDGHAATAEMLQKAELNLESVQQETLQAREAMAKEAPEFSQTLSFLMEQYAASNSRSDQSIVKGELEGLLDRAGDGLQSQVQGVRDQVRGMFQKSEEMWNRRAAAQGLQILNAQTLTEERNEKAKRGETERDSQLLDRKTQERLQHDPRGRLIETDENSGKVRQLLREKGIG
jgi:hypothetical protein